MAANVRNKCQRQSKQQQQLGTTTNENEKTISQDVFARGHTLFYSILMCVEQKQSLLHQVGHPTYVPGRVLWHRLFRGSSCELVAEHTN